LEYLGLKAPFNRLDEQMKLQSSATHPSSQRVFGAAALGLPVFAALVVITLADLALLFSGISLV
jgi:hypothetical protein